MHGFCHTHVENHLKGPADIALADYFSYFGKNEKFYKFLVHEIKKLVNHEPLIPTLYYENFSSLTLSHLLKVTKFLVKVSQIKVLVMTEKNIFVYKLFLSLNISNFSYVLCKNCNPPEKDHPLFPSNPL